MNFLFNYRVTLSIIINNDVDRDKLVKSITKLSKANNNLLIIGECLTSDAGDKHLYINIQNKKPTFNFSHLFYDGHSIHLILNKIDQIYKGEIDNHKFNIYDPNYSKFKIFINNIKLLPIVNLKTLYNIVNKNINRKKRIKILKTKFNEEVSTKEIMHYLIENVDNIKITKYCLFFNARKKFNEYENYLGNLVYWSRTFNKNDDIKKVSYIQKDNNKETNIENILNNTFPNGLMINSYLNFTLPSFVTSLKPPTVTSNQIDQIIIHPKNNDKKYIIVDYYY
jgi:hypothetical protein